MQFYSISERSCNNSKANLPNCAYISYCTMYLCVHAACAQVACVCACLRVCACTLTITLRGQSEGLRPRASEGVCALEAVMLSSKYTHRPVSTGTIARTVPHSACPTFITQWFPHVRASASDDCLGSNTANKPA